MALGVSSLAGILSGLLGVGGGILKVPVLVTSCGIPMKAAAATSNFMIGVTAVASAFVFYGRGDVSLCSPARPWPGSFSDREAHDAFREDSGHTSAKAFAVIMAIVAIQMLWKAWRG